MHKDVCRSPIPPSTCKKQGKYYLYGTCIKMSSDSSENEVSYSCLHFIIT